MVGPNEASKAKILAALFSIVPEAQDETIREDVALRDQFDMDSVDFLNFVIRLHEVFGVEIPESDYRQLTSLEKINKYLETGLKSP